MKAPQNLCLKGLGLLRGFCFWERNKAMKKLYLEAGKIVNTHGLLGEVKILPWADSAAFLQGFSRFYLNGEPISVLSARVHKNCLIARLEGVDTVAAAQGLKNQIVSIARADANLPPGDFFIQDILGLPVQDEQGVQIGILQEILPAPGADVYVVAHDNGAGTHMIPDVSDFMLEKNLEAGFIRVRLIEGM